MKKIYLFALASILSLVTFGQNVETEPNNSFATANTTENYSSDFYNASLGGGDVIDYFKPAMPWQGENGNYRITLEVTNTGTTSADFNFKMYNNSGLVVHNENVSTSEVPVGATVSREFSICGQFMDDFYIVFSSNGSFDYTFSSYVYNLIKDKEPNNTRNQAIMFNNNEEEESGIQYLQSLGGTQKDEVDYHKILLESGDYDLLSLIIKAQNNSCTAGQWIQYECFKNEETTPIATGYVGDNNSVKSLYSVKSKISLSDFQEGDYLTFKITASAAFGYKFRVGYAGTLPNNAMYDDDENNDDYYDAIPLPKSKVKFGNVGRAQYDEEEEYDSWYVEDEYDTYKITLSQPDNLTFYISAAAQNCEIDDWMTVYFDLLDENGDVITERNIFIPSEFVYCYGDTLGNSVKINNLEAGTYYIRMYSSYDYLIENGAWINYSIFYTSPLVSDSPDPEPNDDIEDAIPTIPNTTYNGNVGKGDDYYDSYQFIMPYAGAADFTFKATNDACGSKSYLNYNLVDKKGSNIYYGQPIFEWDTDASCDNLQTIHIKTRGLEADTFYIQLFAYEVGGASRNTALITNPVTYNFSYQFVDQANSDPEPNGKISEAIPVAPGEIKKGRVNFYDADNSQADYADYYSLNLPAAGNIDLIFKSTHRSNRSINNQYDKLLSLQSVNLSFFNVETPGYPKVGTVYPDSSYIDTFRICAVGAGPLLIKIQGKSSEYEFHFEMKDEVTGINEIEPNDNLHKQIFSDSSLIKATINYFENNTYDGEDNYKIPINNTGPITLYVKATNNQCVEKPGNAYLHIRAQRNGGSNVFDKNIANNNKVAPGETIYDTIQFSMTASDTLFLQFYSSFNFEYEFFTSLFKPTKLFEIKGDTTVCIGVQQYVATNITQENIVYHWNLPNGGGTITWVDSVATVTWTNAGTFPVELYLSNPAGNSITKKQNVIVNDQQPTIAPQIFNFARNLSTSSLPPGTTVQWYRNGNPIIEATDSIYYAALGGNYTARFINDCGSGPISNPYSFPADVITQSISFPHSADMQMAPKLKLKLSATASSGLPVFYSMVTGPGTISDDSLIINGAGIIIIKAEQPGNDEFRSAETQFDTITVTKGVQVITFNPIPDQWYRNGIVHPDATSSAGQNISYSVVSGNATGGNQVAINGVGNITIQANQGGNANYNAAAPVQQTFCVGIDTLPVIKGAATACLGTYTYTVEKIKDANYVWTISGGGTIVTKNDTAFVTWTATGAHTINAKANSNCNAIYGVAQELNITVANVTPESVISMLPANGAVGQSLPLVLSWVPGQYTESYDLYVWDSAASRPATPYKKDIAGISFTIAQNAFPYNTTYKWQLISKNPCHTNNGGPVHTFRLVPLPDLIVTNVLAPTSAISGQIISITWTVKNDGPGATLATQNWQDNVYLSFDNTPNLDVPPNTNPGGWSMLDLPVRPLLINSKTNVAALQPGEQYTSTINFKLPVSYSVPVYLFVRTNGNKSIIEAENGNNTDSAANPIVITLAPTPDLRVDSVFTPNTVFSGAEINVTYKVKNYGSHTLAGAQWSDQVYISQSQLFDSATAIKLSGMSTQPGYFVRPITKTYYPNVPEGTSLINSQLPEGTFYTRSIKAVIPNFIFGQWFIHVKTNFDRGVYEGPSFGNNTNSNAVQVYLTPTPHLTVNSVTLAVSEASTTQPIGLNWVIKNTGFTDNLEKNHGHYFTIPTGLRCPCPGPPPPPGSVCYGPPIYYDSTAQGNSYWLDRIYISKDPSALDINNATMLYEYQNGLQQYAGVLYWFGFGGCGTHGIFNTDRALLPNRTFANSANFKVPQNMEPGTYYIYVYTNPTKTVFEYPGTTEIRRSGPLVIERPDVVAALNVPANAVAGAPVQIEYTISNNGPGSVFNHLRVDQIYVSTNSVFDGSAKLVATKPYMENVLTGTPVTHRVPFTLHPSQSGTRYFFVKTNTSHSFAETDTTNNLSAAGTIIFAAAAPVDLIVSELSIPDTVLAGVASYWEYTITNNGTGAGIGKATDSFFVSCNPLFSPSTAIYIGKKERDRNIEPGATVTDTFSTVLRFTYQLNNCFPNDDYNNAYFFVKTNATDSIYEGSNSANNTTASSRKVIKNVLIDLEVSSVNGPASAIVGRPYSLSWKIQNVGEDPYLGFNNSIDSAYISPDSVLNNNAIPFGELKWDKRPMKPKILDNHLFKNFINVPTGEYYVLVKINAEIPSGIIGERNFANNVNLIRDEMGKAKTISVVRNPLPDLVDSIISYPAISSPGQPITVIHRIKNIGAGDSYPNQLTVQLWLSDDAQGNYATHSLDTKVKKVIIPAGGFVDDTIRTYIPRDAIARNYSLVTSIDENKQVVEANELNNRAVVFINIFIPEPVDLLITSLQAVDTTLLGYRLDSVRYIIKNNSGNPAVGYTSDGFYLSTSDVFDSSAVLMGIKEKRINMQPLALDTLKHSPIISGVTEGSYNLFVNTDLTNTIPETNETNNTAMVSTPVYVKVKELQLDELESNTLTGTTRFYKLNIPDSLNGATISVQLTTNLPFTKVNQMFIGKGYVPDAAHFDFTYPTANYGNQNIIMDYTPAGTYYISFRCINSSATPQNITLKARKLPFEISSIQSVTGGNIGNVTVKINGALFTEGMTAKLNKSGTEIKASTVYFTNTTAVYATFNLQGKPLGIYNLTLSKGDTSFALLNNGFSIVKADNGGLITGSGPNTGAGNGSEPGCDPGAASGLNSQLVTELIVPDKIFAGWPFVIQINFKNPTNFDIPAQVRTLYAENFVKLGLTPESTQAGPHSLTFQMTETDGPPGVLRAGGSGTIFIYGRSNDDVPGHTFSLVNLK